MTEIPTPPPPPKETKTKVMLRDLDSRTNNNTKPTFYWIGNGAFLNVEFGPYRLLVVGGETGAGKTTLAFQWIVDALLENPELRCLFVSTEVPIDELLMKQFARLSGVDIKKIRANEMDDDERVAVQYARNALHSIEDQLEFADSPYTIGSITEQAKAHRAKILVVDYVQVVGREGFQDIRRGTIDTIDKLKTLKNEGMAVIALSSISPKYSNGRIIGYDFAETKDIKLAADLAYILETDQRTDIARLKCAKDRFREPRDLSFPWNPSIQKFEIEETVAT